MTLLNPRYYSTQLEYLLGQDGKTDDATSVTVDKVYTYGDDQGTMTYSEATSSSLAATLEIDGETCTCSNYLREISYLVRLEAADTGSSNSEQGSRYYSIASISATVVVGAVPLTAGSCDKTRAEDREAVAVN